MRKTPMPPRKAYMARGGPIRTKKRSTSEFFRVYGGKARVAWVKTLPCIVASVECSGEIQNAHSENGGTGRKADYDKIFPACTGHHGLLHRQGVRWFQTHYAVSLSTIAATTQRLWEAHHA